MRALIQRYYGDRAGATAIEYALIAMLVSIAGIVGFTAMANSVRVAYTEQGEAVSRSTDRYR